MTTLDECLMGFTDPVRVGMIEVTWISFLVRDLVVLLLFPFHTTIFIPDSQSEKYSVMLLQAGIGDSIRKPTRRSLLASTADSVASRLTCRFWKPGAELGIVLARFNVVDSLLGGSSPSNRL